MHILVEYSEDSLFDSSDADGLARIDIAAPAQRYGDLVYTAMRERYPIAAIEIVLGINDRVFVNGLADHELEPIVSQVVNDVFRGWKWVLPT